MQYKPQRDKINEASEETNKQLDEEMSVAPVLMNENIQVAIPKNMVLDSGWFDEN